MNAISMTQRDQLRPAFEALEADDWARVIVIREKRPPPSKEIISGYAVGRRYSISRFATVLRTAANLGQTEVTGDRSRRQLSVE